MSGVFVALKVLSIALWLVSWFGVRACGAGVPLFYVKSTGVAIIPIRKVLDGIGIGCPSWLLAIVGGHLVGWGWDGAVRIICPWVIVGWWCVASSFSRVPSPASCCILPRAASIVARLIGGLYVLGGRYVCQD